MATQRFEGKEHAAVYLKYRFAPGKELKQTILSYLQEKKAIPAELAVDVGCGSGQGTHFLGEHFKKVVGTDISAAQIQEAKDTPGMPNISYLVSPAEELPFQDGSVDVLTSFTAAHWFDIERFMREAERVLRPGGCVAISTYTVDMSLRYGDCSEKLTQIFRECWDQILKYSHDRLKYVLDNYQVIFEALPFPDKKRVTDIYDPIPMTVEGVVGYMESASPYQTFKKSDPQAATSLLQETEKRMLETMGVCSRETPVEFWQTLHGVLWFILPGILHPSLLTPSLSIADCQVFAAEMSCLSLTPMLVLVLMLGVSLGAAFPHGTLRKDCRLSKYQTIASEEKEAANKMKHEFVNNHKCNTRLFHRKWNAVNLPMSDRVLLVVAELNLTIAMLELPAEPSFAEVRRQPLKFFDQARADVLGCVDPAHQPSGRLRHRLHKLQEAMRTESTECLRASTMLNVLQVLDNLQCAALRHHC
ncbi:hypothetical protein TURU_133595 [Turdus rufiventris]|nr:hypothetical protein TURU_133595 [Turdus rufiventris]